MSKKDGGPAFPIYTPDMNLGEDAGPGMSLRDWFAGQVAAGRAGSTVSRPTPKNLAEFAYQCADAMLAARSLPQPDPEESIRTRLDDQAVKSSGGVRTSTGKE